MTQMLQFYISLIFVLFFTKKKVSSSVVFFAEIIGDVIVIGADSGFACLAKFKNLFQHFRGGIFQTQEDGGRGQKKASQKQPPKLI